MYRLLNFNTRIIAFHQANINHFKSQMEFLKENYEVVPLQQALNDLDKMQVVITFDDGYKNNLEVAYPVLKKLGLKATVYVTYDFIDKNTFAWWDRIEYKGVKADFAYLKSLSPKEVEKEVEELTGLKKTSKKPNKYDFMSWADLKKISDVFEIGSHTLTHPILTNIEDPTKELMDSKVKMSRKITQEVKSLAYPNGNWDENIVKISKKVGYNNAVVYTKGNNTSSSDRFTLRRRGININDDLKILAAKVAGLF